MSIDKVLDEKIKLLAVEFLPPKDRENPEKLKELKALAKKLWDYQASKLIQLSNAKVGIGDLKLDRDISEIQLVHIGSFNFNQKHYDKVKKLVAEKNQLKDKP